jgi:alpha-tubulin suppressor-like RCC1 family protein
MISTELLIEKARQLAATSGLTADQLAQLSAIENFISNDNFSVATVADLPDPAANKGRLVYIVAEEDFYFSRGVDWTTVFDSTIDPVRIRIYSWGSNQNGRLGDNTIINKSSPAVVVGGINNWSQVFSGYHHSFGLTSAGVLYSWGRAANGQLGDNSTVAKSSPVTVVGGITTWSSISGGDGHSVGLTSTGVVYAWGVNSLGQVGNNTGLNTSSPVTVVGGITNWSQVSSGVNHALGIANGVAYAWGFNGQGQIGDGTTITKSSPVTIIGGITTWNQISAGSNHSLGLTAGGVIYAWGRGTNGRLGDNTTIDKSSPVTVVGGITNWTRIIAGKYSHNIGVTSDNIAYAWGQNNRGQLGDNTTINKSSPVTVVGGVTNWSTVRSGFDSNLALTTSGVLYAWGYNTNGQLGSSSVINRSSPVTVVGGITEWSSLSSGAFHNLAIETIEKGFNEP